MGKAKPVMAPAPQQENVEPEEGASFEELEQAPPSDKEFWLLKLLLRHDELLPQAEQFLDFNWIPHSLVRAVAEQRIAAHMHQTWQNLGAFLGECESDAMRALITEAAFEERKLPNPDQQLTDVMLRLRNEYLDRQIAGITQQAAQPDLADKKKIELLQTRQALQKQKRSALEPVVY